jgi:hypothetical protein
MILRKILGGILLCSFILQPLAYGTNCQPFSPVPRPSIHPSRYVQHLSLLSMCVSDLMPQIEKRLASSTGRFKEETSALRKPKNRTEKIRKTNKRVRAKGFSEVIYSLDEELKKNKKNLIELLTSYDSMENRMGREAFFRLLKVELPWKKKHGRRQFLMPKIDQFLERVRGQSEDQFGKFYDWFLSEVQMSKRYFKNGGPRLKRKDRPWRRGLSEKEAHIHEWMMPEELTEETQERDLIQTECSQYEDDQLVELCEEDGLSEYTIEWSQDFKHSDLERVSDTDEFEEIPVEDHVIGYGPISRILRHKYKEQKRLEVLEKRKAFELEKFEDMADEMIN